MRNRIFITAITLLLGCFSSNAQVKEVNFNQFVQEVESNNPSLIALKKQYEASIVGNRVGLAPSDPEVNFEPLFNGETEITAVQSLAFPTMYFKMSKLAKLSTQRQQMEYYSNIHNTLLIIRNIGVDAIYYNKKLLLLEEVYQNALKVENFMTKRFENGDANIMDKNKVKAMVMDANAQKNSALSEYKSLERQIVALNMSKELKIVDTNYPLFKIGDAESYVERALAESYAIRIANMDSLIAQQQIKISKHSWLPNINIGYKYVLESASPQSSIGGVVVGLSVPLWQNLNKVKYSRLQYEATKAEMLATKLNTKAFLEGLVSTYQSSVENMERYREHLKENNSSSAILKALELGEISVMEYFVEANTITDIKLNLLEYERAAYNTAAQMQAYLY